MKYILAFFLSCFSISYADDHWAVGAWDCRSWGAIRLLDDHYAIDLDPEGHLNSIGAWQDFDQNSIIIAWIDTTKIEIIQKNGDKFFRQSYYGFGAGSELQETKKILTEKENK